MKEVKTVPIPVYEMEMEHKDIIIKRLFALIFLLVIIISMMIYLFISFLGEYDFATYEQNGNGINNLNQSIQGGAEHESTIKNGD